MSMCLQRQYYSVFLPLSFIFYPWRKNFAQRYNKKKRYANKSAKKWKKHYLVCVVNFRLLSTIGVGWFSLFLFAVLLPSFYRLFTVIESIRYFYWSWGFWEVIIFVRGEGQEEHFGWVCRNIIIFLQNSCVVRKKQLTLQPKTKRRCKLLRMKK